MLSRMVQRFLPARWDSKFRRRPQPALEVREDGSSKIVRLLTFARHPFIRSVPEKPGHFCSLAEPHPAWKHIGQ